jgi:hypothetical protein
MLIVDKRPDTIVEVALLLETELLAVEEDPFERGLPSLPPLSRLKASRLCMCRTVCETKVHTRYFEDGEQLRSHAARYGGFWRANVRALTRTVHRRTEAGAFSHLFAAATQGKGGSIGGKDAVAFFLKSQVPVPVLKQVWSIAANGQPEMQLREFNTAMRLIALAQKGVTISAQTLDQTRGMQVPLPVFQGV